MSSADENFIDQLCNIFKYLKRVHESVSLNCNFSNKLTSHFINPNNENLY